MEPKETCVAGTLASHGGAIDFACNAVVSVGGACCGYTSSGTGGGVGAEWWGLAKLSFVVRGVRPEASMMPGYDGLAADEVLGVGAIYLRDVICAPNCRLECELELLVRYAVGDPMLGKLIVAAELREESVPVLARR